jgi:molybdenum cofactor cytidylyltransferase
MNQCGAIILAAGRSQRMGRPKLALPFDREHSFLNHIVFRYHAFGCHPLVVVVNPNDAHLSATLLEGLPYHVFTVVNPQPEAGRFLSLQKALQVLEKPVPVFVHNVDHPFVNHQVLKNLRSNIQTYGYATPCHKGRGGHPLLLSQAVVHDIVLHDGKVGRLDHFLKRHERIRVEVSDPCIHYNINTPADYRTFLQYMHSDCIDF